MKATCFVLLAAWIAAANGSGAQDAPQDVPGAEGVVTNRAGASPGYTLFAPFNSGETYLIDLDGRVVHTWHSEFPPGQAACLLDDGDLLRCARDPGESPFRGGGEGGRIERFDWDGELVWTYVLCDAQRRQHHDVEPMPNGNVLVAAWELKTPEEAIDAGRDADAARSGLWPDCVLEIEPVLPSGGKVVWEWHVFDHLIQDRDPEKPSFGVISEHPERLDINVLRPDPRAQEPEVSDEELERLRRLGYVGPEEEGAPPEGEGRPGPRRGGRDFGDRGPGRGRGADWNHVNSVAYHRGLDQIVLSSHNQHEIWIIDHGTTTEEAAANRGGKRGRGGDFLYRWGNPAAWKIAGEDARQLTGQHDAHWIDEGLPGAGRLLVFNNNASFGMRGRGGGEPSFALELELPLLEDGTYSREADQPFGPAQPLWKFSHRDGDRVLSSPIVSGSQRLPNGNTLVTSGAQGWIVEVTPQGEIVWDFRNPFGREPEEGRPVDGFGPPAGGPGGGVPPGGFGPGGPGGFMQGAFFKALRYAPDHPALRGRELKPRDA